MKATKEVEESSDDSDSDYNPNDDKKSDDDEVEAEADVADFSSMKRRKLNALWDDLKHEDETHVKEHMEKSLNQFKPSTKIVKKKTKNSNSKANRSEKRALESMLASIFGHGRHHQSPRGHTRSAEEKEGMSEDVSQSLKEKSLKAAKLVSKKVKVSEVRKFAGESIRVERTVSTSSSTAVASSAAKKDSLDNVLETLKGPKAISTVSKSSADWDNFKEKEGLEDALAAASKDGFDVFGHDAYITKQEFLSRCDYRAFENERDERIKSRAKA